MAIIVICQALRHSCAWEEVGWLGIHALTKMNTCT